MMVTFYVWAEQPCPECLGTGVVTHPAWREYWTVHPDGFPTAEDDARWFREQGYTKIPPEEVDCGACGGTGYLSWRVPLQEALERLGK